MEKKMPEDSPYFRKYDPSKKGLDYKKGEAPVLRSIACELPILPRKNEADLTDDEKDAFNAVIAQLIADGSYQDMIEIHSADMTFMHGGSGSHEHGDDEGAIRFLPWHRVYLYELEKLISNYDPNIKIPYWNWIENPTVPSWVDQQNATRDVGALANMPKGSKVCNVFNETNYLDFTQLLESYHGTVHVHVGGNMADVTTSPTDPLFWLHHAFVDKIWNDWQHIYPGDFAEVDGSDALDPWTVEISEAQDITDFCTYYEGFECVAEFNDNETRDIINRMDCDQINEYSDSELVDLVNNMISGFTGNSDEQAILKLFNCLDCDRLSRIVKDIGTDTLLSNFHGAEDDELQLLLGTCGIISLASWDDDVTRDFVNQSSCSDLNALSDNDLCDLINNMLSGATYNADEQAILKLLKCLTCDRLSDVVNLVGLDDLLDNFQGDEDDQLQLLLGKCGIISFSSWNDDVTRAFVDELSCSEINALSNNDLRDLINNMISGSTGNADEQAILKILGCLNCSDRTSVVDKVGKSTLLSNLHGDEDDQLRDLFDECGI
jgi:hypothetical protein